VHLDFELAQTEVDSMLSQLVTIAVLSLLDTAGGQSSGATKCETDTSIETWLDTQTQSLSTECRKDGVASKVGKQGVWGTGTDGASPCKPGATKCTLHLKPHFMFACSGDAVICATAAVTEAIAAANAKSVDIPMDRCIPTVCVSYADLQKADVMFAKDATAAMCRTSETALLGTLDATSKSLITATTTSTAEITCEGDNPITTAKPTATVPTTNTTSASTATGAKVSFARSSWSLSSALVVAGFGVALLQ